MNWIGKHVDTMVVLGGILSSVLWLNSKFNELEKEVAVIKTILVMKDIYPKEMALNHNKDKRGEE